jgi:hypothetical protein
MFHESIDQYSTSSTSQLYLQPVNPSHHIIDVVTIPIDGLWYLFYTEQRDGHAFLWQQRIHSSVLSTSYELPHDAVQVRHNERY